RNAAAGTRGIGHAPRRRARARGPRPAHRRARLRPLAARGPALHVHALLVPADGRASNRARHALVPALPRRDRRAVLHRLLGPRRTDARHEGLAAAGRRARRRSGALAVRARTLRREPREPRAGGPRPVVGGGRSEAPRVARPALGDPARARAPDCQRRREKDTAVTRSSTALGAHATTRGSRSKTCPVLSSICVAT